MDDDIKRINEILLIDVEASASPYLDDLEHAEQGCEHVSDVAAETDPFRFFEFNLEIFSDDIYQVKHNFQVDELRELGNSKENALE